VGADLAEHEPCRVVNADFRRPLLVIQGDADPYVPLDDIESLIAAAGGPAELWRVAGGRPSTGPRVVPGRMPAASRRILRLPAESETRGDEAGAAYQLLRRSGA
jgi:fermentation-respiration switch protein FrsA (DUF1100 family)